MKKRNLCIFLVINLLLICTACSDQKNNAVMSEETLKTPEVSKTPEVAGMQYHRVWDLIELDEQAVKPKTKEVKYHMMNIRYPYFQDKKIKSINKLIKHSLFAMLEKGFGRGWKELKDVELKIDYNIMCKNNKFISMCFEGDTYTKGAAHPEDIFYSMNIDIEREMLYKLSDFCDINEKFITEIKEGLRGQYPEDYWDVLDLEYGEDLERELKKADQIKKHVLTGSYFHNKELVVWFVVPHAIGGHIFIAIDPADIDKNM